MPGSLSGMVMGRAGGFGSLCLLPAAAVDVGLVVASVSPKPWDHQDLNKGNSFGCRGAIHPVFAQLPVGKDAACVPGESHSCLDSVLWTPIIDNSPANEPISSSAR